MKAGMAEPPSMAELLSQRESWYAHGKGRVRLRDMDERHITNLLAWLDRNAARLQSGVESSLFASTGGPHGDAAQDAIDSMFAELGEDPFLWLHRQPLYEALLGVLAGYRLKQPGTPAEPPLRAGDVIYGYCNGKFGDSWHDRRVEAIGPDWVVLRAAEPYYDQERSLYSGSPDDLKEYRYPVCMTCSYQGPSDQDNGGRCSRCGDEITEVG